MVNALDPIMMDILENDNPKFNKDIADGLARHYVKVLPRYLDAVFKSAMSTIDSSVPMIYKGFRKLSPLEDFYNNINASASKNIIDIGRDYIYKVEYGFEYNNKAFNRVIALPYVDRGGYLKLSDSHYCLNPVLSEYPISPAPSELFVRVLRDKLNIKKMYRNILVDDEKVSIQIIHSRSYKLVDKVNDIIPIALYSFVKYGFLNTFKKLFNTVPKIMRTKDIDTTALRKNYKEYTTTGIRPRTLNTVNYVPHNISIFIKKEDVNPILETYVASLIYSFDLTPAFAEQVPTVIKGDKPITTDFDFSKIDDESLFWVTLLGKVIFKNRFTLDRVQTDMLEHINILNGYLDLIVKEKLLEINIDVDDFFELLNHCIISFNDLVLNYENYSSKLDNRYIDLPYYILFVIIVGVNKAFLEFKRASSNRILTEKELARIFNKVLSTKKIYKNIKSNAINLGVTPVSNTSDNMYFNMTSILEDQNRGSGVSRSKKNAFPLNTKFISAEDIVFGSMLHMSKKNPSPRFKINPYTNVDIKTGKFIIDTQTQEMIDCVRPMLTNTFENDTIVESENIAEIAELV